MIDVVCAIIIQDSRVLVCQRAPDKNEGDKWEFPGGKVEPGEDFETALIREIEEELGIRITVGESLTSVEFQSIRLRPYRCQIAQGELTLHEHTELRWLDPSEDTQLDWAQADIPIWQEVVASL